VNHEPDERILVEAAHEIADAVPQGTGFSRPSMLRAEHSVRSPASG
jgi:hypothetical protein